MVQFTFKITKDGSAYICTGTTDREYQGEIVIPASHEGLPVTEIGHSAFKSCKLSALVISDSVEWINIDAFRDCKHLKKISFSDPGKSALQYISFGAFCGCEALKSVWLPKDLMSIDNSAFNMTEITIPNRCVIRYQTNSTEYKIIRYALPRLYQSDEPFELIFQKSGNQKGYICAGITDDYHGRINIPAAFNGLPVVGIGYQAFRKSSLTEVVIPPSVEFIDSEAFYNSALEHVTFLSEKDSRLKSVEGRAFLFCDALKEVRLPPKTEVIEYSAFDQVALTIPERCIVQSFANDGGSIETYKLPPLPPIETDELGQSFRLTEDGTGYVFVKCNCHNPDKLVRVPAIFNGLPVIEIGAMAFSSSDAERIFIPKTVKKAGYFPLYGLDELWCVYFEGSRKEWEELHIYCWVSVSCDVECL